MCDGCGRPLAACASSKRFPRWDRRSSPSKEHPVSEALPAGRPGSSDGSLARLARLPIAAAILTIGLKFGAYALTGSAGLLSDAIESSVNLVAAVVALFSLWYAAKPVDRSHTYGHEKIAYFSSGLEGGLILVAAAGIIWFSVERLFSPRSLETVGLGLALALVAAGVNLATALVLLRAARAHGSVILGASGQHLMTDVWTSVGAVAGVLLAQWTGFLRIDP
ncbi:MAG: cation transporter, partial [Thermomicrobiales bacterium]|nr:cation transporter [Thermomicrobiales bacterium]